MGTVVAQRRTPERSIRVAWRRVFAGVCVLVVLLGATAFGVALAQRALFQETTAPFQAEVGAAVELSRQMRRAERSLGAVLYEFGTEAELRSAERQFGRASGRIGAGLDRALDTAPSGPARRHLLAARASWDEVARLADEARGRWGTGEVQAALSAGNDPYLGAWDALSAAQESLNEYTATSVQRLRAQINLGDARAGFLVPALLATIVVALTIVLVAGRRLTHRLISPIVAITGVARRMEGGDLAVRVGLDPDVRELADLAGAVNALGESLQGSLRELQAEATTDPLTGLPNRRALHEYLDRRVAAGPAAGLALLFIDLDDFKVVNDTLGHPAGDELLRIVAERLRASSRPSDLVARLGGDEFAVVVEPGPDAASAHETVIARRILDALDAPVALGTATVRTGGSIGIATVTGGEQTVDDALRDADIAMYAAKRHGKGRYERFGSATDGVPGRHA